MKRLAPFAQIVYFRPENSDGDVRQSEEFRHLEIESDRIKLEILYPKLILTKLNR